MTAAGRTQIHHEIAVTGGALHVYEWPSGEASTPLLLLHGFTGAGRGWDESVECLAYPGRVVAPDLPGHGASLLDDLSAYEIESVARALDIVLATLKLPRVALVGYSMGGRLALYYAITRPSRLTSLVLESASAGIADRAERSARVAADEELADYAVEVGIERFVDRWECSPVLATQLRLSPSERARLRMVRIANSPAGLARSLRGMGTGAQPYVGARLGEVSAPTLVMAGAEDAKFSALARTMAASIPAAKLAILPRVGHTPHLEDPARWVEVVSQFINIGRKAA